MGSDRFTAPIKDAGENFDMPGAADDLSNLILKGFSDQANIIVLRFGGVLGQQVGQFTDDGSTPSPTVGAPIYAGQEWEVSRRSFECTKIIGIGATISVRVEQYEAENPYNNKPC